jgi:hypothetical protein
MTSFVNNLNIIKGSKSAGLDIWITPDDKLEINVVVISSLRNKINILYKKSISSIEELPSVLSANLPIYLSIDGKGILHKIVDSQNNGPLLDALLPNANKNDFIIQHTVLEEKRELISLIRNEKLEEILLKINEYGFNILKIYLGPFSLVGILQFSEVESMLLVPYYKVLIKNNSIDGFERNSDSTPDFSIDIESENLSSAFIVPFSNSLQHFIENSTILIDYPKIIEQKGNYQFRRLFQITILLFALFLFVSLFINFLLFEHCQQKNNLLVSQIGTNREIFNKIEREKSLISSREEFLKTNKIRNRSYLAYFSDRFAKEVPVGITLGRLNIFPLQKQVASKEIPISFQNGRILIIGSTYNSSCLNLWITDLKKYSWINEISIKNYTDNGSGPASFELDIDLKESEL